MNIQAYFNRQIRKIDRALSSCLPRGAQCPPALGQAMRYAVLAGGKRIRPILTLEACRAVGGKEKDALSAACAIEFIHSYSLVHDDLPCMDNDSFRRGKPTVHKKFGQSTALLAGDALLTLAFGVLNPSNGAVHPPELKRRLEAARLLAEAAGTAGMAGGQALDLEFQSKTPSLIALESINRRKTGALIAASTRIGALLGGGDESQIRALFRYGQQLGLLFQIVDDILDSEGYAKAMGPVRARREAERVLQQTKKTLQPFGEKARILALIADFVYTRDH